jgi:hypothetical protein
MDHSYRCSCFSDLLAPLASSLLRFLSPSRCLYLDSVRAIMALWFMHTCKHTQNWSASLHHLTLVSHVASCAWFHLLAYRRSLPRIWFGYFSFSPHAYALNDSSYRIEEVSRCQAVLSPPEQPLYENSWARNCISYHAPSCSIHSLWVAVPFCTFH